MDQLQEQVFDILDSSKHLLSNVKPSEWNEQHRVMTTDVSPFPGRFSYNRTPYLREVVDCISPNHPAKIVAIQKGAQIGFSTGVIEAGIGWIISQNPGNILFLTGHADLAEEAMNGKIDQLIDSCGLRPLIRPNVLRAKNMRTGDTNKSKEFPGGSLVSGSAGNHKLLRQRSVRYGFIDDFDAAKSSSKESGATTEMIEQRFAAYSQKMKLFYISTPELKATSNIEPVYLLGDQRKYHIPCPCCGGYIALGWSVPLKDNDKEMGGITWKLDSANKLIESSVGYICQLCSGFFTDRDKYELNLLGEWRPTATPSEIGYYSYHISSLYAPPGMYDWLHYVRQFLNANPINEPILISKMKTFTNVVLGETYEEVGESPKANELAKNTMPYEVDTIPETLSIKHGNGKIVLLTAACDLNGTPEDARLDYEIVGWSESGASYSINEGSIGTFIPREGLNKKDRERWTYEPNRPNNVWVEFDKILAKVYVTDTNRRMRIFISGVDCGFHSNFAYNYVDRSNFNVVGLKGKDSEKYIRWEADIRNFRAAKERPNLYLVEVNRLKDELAELMKLKYDDRTDQSQPPGFLNFPVPSGGKYTFKNYFSHFEAEHRVTDNKEGQGVSSRWVKKSSIGQNHKFDCRIYGMVLRDIMVDMVCRELKMKQYGWDDYVKIVLGK